MEDCHRKIILDNLEALVEKTDYIKLVNACKHYGIISSTMEKIIEENTTNEREKHRKLFIKITKRGPTAFKALLNILNDFKYTEATEILDKFISIKTKKLDHLKEVNLINKKNNNTTSEGSIQSQPDGTLINDSINENSSELTPHTKINKTLYKVKKSSKFFIDPKIEVYTMKKKNRGVLFMVNIIDFINHPEQRRNGAEIDGERLLHIFDAFGYTIFYDINLTSKQFYHKLSLILNSQYVKGTESFVMALMTHGNMKGEVDRVEFNDNSVESVHNILRYFENRNCPYLVGKPKVFLLPFCRGDISDRGTRIQTDSIDEKQVRPPIPSVSDIYLAFATVPGFKTHRDPDDGSWYIQKFCEVFAEYAHDMDLEDMLKIIGKKTNYIRSADGRMQTSSGYDMGWYKKLYFNPGYYEID